MQLGSRRLGAGRMVKDSLCCGAGPAAGHLQWLSSPPPATVAGQDTSGAEPSRASSGQSSREERDQRPGSRAMFLWFPGYTGKGAKAHPSELEPLLWSSQGTAFNCLIWQSLWVRFTEMPIQALTGRNEPLLASAPENSAALSSFCLPQPLCTPVPREIY